MDRSHDLRFTFPGQPGWSPGYLRRLCLLVRGRTSWPTTHGVVLVTFHAERDGQTVALRSADIWHLADGKATEHWSFFEDQAAADKLFS
jgi:hypothetical protein